MKSPEIPLGGGDASLKTRNVVLLLLLLAFAGYGAALNNYFFLDDTTGPYAGFLLSREPWRIFSENFDVIYMSRLWRPVVALSYVPNYLWGGLNPWSYHLVSTLLHAGCGVASYLIALRLTGRKQVALLTAVLGAMTMTKADAVMMLAHRTTLLGALFSLCSFLCYTRLLAAGWSRRDALLCAGCFLLGIFSYETTLALPGAFLGTGALLYGRAYLGKKRELALALALLALSGALILGLGLAGGGAVGAGDAAQGVALRGWHIARNLAAVVPIFVIPPFLLHYPTNSYHNVPLTFGWVEMAGTGLLALFTWLGFRLKEPAVLVGVLFFLVLAAPTTQVPWLYYPDAGAGQALMKLRWSVGKFSYLPCFGFYLAAGILLTRLYDSLKGSLPGAPLAWGAGLLLAWYLLFNWYWLQQRAGTWRAVGETGRKEVAALRARNLRIPPGTAVYQLNLAYYHRHAQALLRVLYRDPGLRVLDARDWRPGGPANNVFIIDPGSPGPTDLYIFRLAANAPPLRLR